MRRGELAAQVAHHEPVAGLLQIGRHAGAHGAEPDETDRHCVLPGGLPHSLSRRRRESIAQTARHATLPCMAARGIERLAYLVVALLAPAMLLGAPAPLPPTGSLVGQLLIAAPTMGDPRFTQTVILMVRHDQSGALGIVINRPGEVMTLDRLLAAVGAPDATVEGELRVFAGGPVEPGVGPIPHNPQYRR